MPALSLGAFHDRRKSKNQMHEMLAGIPRAGAENPQRVPDELPALQSTDYVRYHFDIRGALMGAKEVRMALEARPKNESLAQGSVGDRSQF